MIRDLDHSNYDSISANLSVNNFVTKFNYITENHDFGDSEVISVMKLKLILMMNIVFYLILLKI